jgi:hypothetical protein
MGAKTVEFFVNGNAIKSCQISASEVCLAACFGGSGQVLVIQDGATLVISAASGWSLNTDVTKANVLVFF